MLGTSSQRHWPFIHAVNRVHEGIYRDQLSHPSTSMTNGRTSEARSQPWLRRYIVQSKSSITARRIPTPINSFLSYHPQWFSCGQPTPVCNHSCIHWLCLQYCLYQEHLLLVSPQNCKLILESEASFACMTICRNFKWVCRRPEICMIIVKLFYLRCCQY